MADCVIKKGAVIDRCIIDEHTIIGENVKMGTGENVPNEAKPKIYNTGITVIGSDSEIPDNVEIGKNCVVFGKSTADMYKSGKLESGQTIDIGGIDI